jgi:hypothetical protein
LAERSTRPIFLQSPTVARQAFFDEVATSNRVGIATSRSADGVDDGKGPPEGDGPCAGLVVGKVVAIVS